MSGTPPRTGKGRGPAVLVLTIALFAATAPSAKAEIWTGSCPVQIDFSFGSRVRSATALSHPSYSFEFSNYLGLPCAVTLDVFQPLRSTSGSGSGSSATWTCESTLGTGWWNQDWTPGLPSVAGSHIITGTWGDWSMVVTNPSLSFSGVVQLTVNPTDAAKLVTCESTGIRRLSMVGTMVFQDPEIP